MLQSHCIMYELSFECVCFLFMCAGLLVALGKTKITLHCAILNMLTQFHKFWLKYQTLK